MYVDKLSNGRVVPVGTGPLAIEDISAVAAVHGEYAFQVKAQVKRLYFQVTTLVAASVTAPVVRFSKRLKTGSDTNAVILGTLTIPSGTPVGSIVYKDVLPVDFLPGNCLKLENTVQAVDGSSAAGQGLYGFEADFDFEQPANLSNMIKSV